MAQIEKIKPTQIRRKIIDPNQINSKEIEEQFTETSIPYRWIPRDYQMNFWNAMTKQNKQKAVIVWHRRTGKDLVCLNLCLYQAFQKVGVYWHVYPTYAQGYKALWNNLTNHGRKYLDYFPKKLVKSINNTQKQVFFINGSVYQLIGADKSDAIVGPNPTGIIMSEYSLHRPESLDLIRPILSANDGWIVFNFTPRGRNHAYKQYQTALKNDDWFAELLTVDDTKIVTQERIQKDIKEGMSEDTAKREYYCRFDVSLTGAYYGKIMDELLAENHIGGFPPENALTTYTAWDIGKRDPTVIIFFQIHNEKIKIIDFYQNDGEGLKHYLKVLDKKPYIYEAHFVPNDMKVEEFTSGESRLKTARKLGYNLLPVPVKPIAEGIEEVRNILPLCYFDEDKSSELIEALKTYRKKFDENLQSYADTPYQDWSRHAADAMRYLAIGYNYYVKGSFDDIPEHTKAITDYNLLGL